MFFKGKIIIGLQFMLAFALHAQQVFEPYFVHIPPERFGASQCYSPFFDGKGGMWFASDKGLKYYNGYTVKTYNHIPGDTNSMLHNQINTFFRDKYGKFWLGYATIGGVTRFDPEKNKFDHFHPDTSNKNSIPDALIVRFKEDDKGRLWALTWGGGLVELDHKTGLCKRIFQRDFSNKADTLGIMGNQVKAMLPLGNDEFLLGYFSGGAFAPPPRYFNAKTGTFKPFDVEPYIQTANQNEQEKLVEALTIVHDIYRDRNGNLWFACYSGLVFLDMKNKTAKRVTAATNIAKGRNLENARGFLEDENGKLWIPTSSTGIMVVDINTLQVTTIKQADYRESGLADNRVVGHIVKDKDGNIWICGGMGGFSVYVPFMQQFQLHYWSAMDLEYSNRSAQEAPCNNIVLVGHDTLAVSSENGISYYSLSQRKLLSQFRPNYNVGVKGKPYPLVSYFFIRDNRLYFNYKYRAVITSVDGKIKYDYPGMNSENGMILVLGDDKRSPILFRTFNRKNLKVYHPETNSFSDFDSINYSFRSAGIEIMTDTAWVFRTGSRGFIIYNPLTRYKILYSCDSTGKQYFPDSTIISCYATANQNIWISTNNGVYDFNPKTGKYVLINKQLGLEQDDIISSLIFDKKGRAWYTVSKKLLRYDPGNNGLFNATEFVEFSLGSFIPKPAFMDAAGKLYFATNRGVLVIDPDKLSIPLRKPELFIGNSWLSNKKMEPKELQQFLSGKSIFSAGENNVLIELHTDQFYTPSPHKFYFRFKNSDTTWTDNGTSNRIRLTNLTHGNYTLEIKVRNGFNIESSIYSVSFTINRPYWSTWWFITLLILVVTSLVYFLIKLRERSLRKKQEELEAIIHHRTAEVVLKAQEIEIQKNVIEEKNKELTDSIYYAQRIQQSILPDESTMRSALKELFVYFRPKDIVSGDFYWFTKQKDSILWAVVDCTGHGVPGGFMSMLGSGLLNQIVNEEQKLEPDEILNHLRDRVMIALRQTGADGESRDGMDISLCRYIISENRIEYAGANNSLYIIRNNELTELKADKQPIGIYVGDKKPFTKQSWKLQKDDLLYMTSDGYADQFGGVKGKKFKSSSFEKLLTSICPFSIKDQYDAIERTFVSWKGDYEQLDDVCVIGVRI